LFNPLFQFTQILLLIREQVAIAKGRLHVGDGMDGGVHNPLGV
jgi:hypothetical protein